MMKTIKRPISIILAVMLVVGMFSILPFSASAAEGDYYVVGTMTNPAWSINEAYKLSLNPNNNNEYMITDVILPKGTQIKIAKEGENNAIDTWYPNGTNNNYTVDADGVYTIYFKPVSEGNIGWHYGLFYPVKTADLDLVAWNGVDTYYTDLDEAVNDNVDCTVILLKDIGDYTPTFTGERLDLDEISIYFNTNNHSFNLQEPQGYALQNGLPYGNEAYVFRKAYLSLNGQNYDSYGYRYVYDDEGYCFIQIGIGADYFDADNDPVIDALGDVAVNWIYGIPDDAVGETILVRKNGHTVTLHDGANANGSKQYVLVEGETDNGVTPYTVSEVIFQASPSYERFASFAEAVSYYNSSNTGFIDQKANCNEEYTIKTTDRSPIKVYHNGYTGLTIKAPQGYELVTSTTDNLTSYSIRLCTHSDLTAYPAVDKNCTTAGNSAYWKCNNCGKYFSDEEGQNEISYGDWVIPAGHTAVNHPAVAATYNAPGNIEYWECAACGKYFADEEMTQEIAAEAVVIPMLTGAVAQVGNTKYETLQEAIDAADGKTVTVLTDLTLTSPATVSAGKTVTIDFADKTVTVAPWDNTFINNGTLTIKGTTGGITGVKGLVDNYGTLTVDSGVYTATAGGTSAAIWNNGNASTTVNGGTITADCYGIYVGNGDTVTVNGGSITSTNCAAISGNGSSGQNGYTIIVNNGVLASVNSVAIYHPNNGSLTIAGGTITGPTAVYVKSGTTTITGGALNGTGAKADYSFNGDGCDPTGDALVVDNCNYPGGPSSVVISGGNFTSTNANGIGSYSGNGVTVLAPVTATTNTISVPSDEKWVDNGQGGYNLVKKEYVAQVGNDKFESLQAAIDAAGASGTVTLLADCGSGSRTYVNVAANQNITIDFGDYTYTSVWGIENHGTLTLTADEGGATATWTVVDNFGTLVVTDGTYTTTGDGSYVVWNHREQTPASSTTVNGGTLTNSGSDGWGIVVEGEDVSATVNGGTVDGGSGYGISGIGNNYNAGYSITVNGGTVTGGELGIYHPNDGTLTITGGTITGATGVYIKSGTTNVLNTNLNITGGTITGNGEAVAYNYNGNGGNPTGDALVIDNCGYPGGAPEVSISGGTFISTNAQAVGSYNTPKDGDEATQAPIKNFISGGTFNKPVPEDFCADGYIPTGADPETGKYTVKQGSYVAQVGETKYETLQEAIDAAGASGTVTLLADCGSGSTSYVNVAEGQNVTIDFGDYTYTSVWGIENHGTLTLTADEGGATGTKAVVDNFGTLVITDGKYEVTDASDSNSPAIRNNSGATTTVNGGSITSSGNKNSVIYNYPNSSADINGGKLTTTTAGSTIIWNNAGASTTIDGGVLNAASGGWGVVVRGQNSSVVMNDGTINCAGDSYGISGIGNASDKGYSITVNGGTINGGDLGVYHPNEGNLTITGGTISGKTGVYVKSGTTTVTNANITGGTIIGNGEAVAYNYNGNGGNPTGDALVIDNCGYPGGAPTVSISGGTFISENAEPVGSYNTPKAGDATTQEPIKNFISGGSFSNVVPAEQCAEGYVPVTTPDSQGLYTVKEDDRLFTGHTISLFGDIDVNFFINPNRVKNATTATITFDCDNGHYTATLNLKDVEKCPVVNGRGVQATFSVPAAYIAHDIHAVVTIDGDFAGDQYYSVQDYAFEIIKGEGNYSDELKTLAKELLNYGKLARNVFLSQMKDKTDYYKTVTGYTMATVEAGDVARAIENANHGELGTNPATLSFAGAKYYNTTIVFLSATTLRHYVVPNGGSLNAADFDGCKSNYYYYVEKKDIPAAELNRQQTFNVCGTTFTYSALDYALAVLTTNGTSTDAQNLVKAMYLYNQAAIEYFKTIS